MSHESDGTVLEWKSRKLQCCECGSEYVQDKIEDSSCPECDRQDFNFNILEEYY